MTLDCNTWLCLFRATKDVNMKTGDHLSHLCVKKNPQQGLEQTFLHWKKQNKKKTPQLSHALFSVSKKFPILQIVLFNFPVLRSLTLVKLFFSCKSPNPLKPCSNIHPHPSFREWLVQPKRNGGSEHDALDEVPSCVLLIHITSPCVGSLLIERVVSPL